ncbi:DNA sulfur modification protein DndD [Sphingomonas kyeonggiensis]|uniref:DNA sulfur modification protein DndD n=1 Tax=Sphingomonas kyeonggiensis TaxID=1268553 RepID=A0A7W7JX60_9SPHN|nr:AAA family ATPase [Sphingomonas kyeonggiensis]MBB4837014.1 DNA sulfur modification protein DndD [Sphingomonas kyeonggiensis]
MKLLRAKFENFRLLRDLEIEFSTDPVRNLTVIRAENETGKTTMLTALQWALYGDEALPGDPKTYRLHPIDSGVGTVRTVVEVDFETVPALRSSRVVSTLKRYRVVRTVTETVNASGWRRGEPTLRLYDLTAKGSDPQEYGENRVRTELPPELREVFFTDGDRALSFIDADSVTVKRQRVENAIKALLGLSIVESAQRHVKQAAADVNKRVRESDASGRAREASARIEALDAELATLEPKQAEAIANRARSEEQYERLGKQIEQALAQGDRSELATQLKRVKDNRKRSDALELALAREQGELLKSKVLAKQLLADAVAVATGKLEALKARGRIPNQTIPVLNECLTQGVCICNETLDETDPDGSRRRQHINEMIEASRAADAIQKTITELYYGARDLMQPGEAQSWRDLYADLMDRRNKVAQTIKDLAAEEAQIEAKIALVPDIDIQHLREQKKIARKHADDYGDAASRAAFRIEAARSERAAAVKERDDYLKEETKGQRLAAELVAGQDVLRVFERALDRLKSDELGRVSALMNEIFLEMIGADTEQGAIIRRAEISQDFDILVYGPDERLLSPDRDLNGASRRALTLAFILALTKVSGVEAPNIIDTPLGMMSGYVKSSVVRVAARYSSQLILFLTRSEIAGTEALLAEYADKVITLTNPAHYPRMLLHAPTSDVIQVVRCDCSYDESCTVCARKMEVEPGAAPLEEAA